MTNPHSTRYSSSLEEGIDYYLDPLGNMVMTQKYHKERGYCCGSGCVNCPWKSVSRKIKDILRNR
jgi:hypothetical protein